MATINPDLSGIVDGAVGDSTDWTTPFNTIINEINGNLDNDNIKALAAIEQSKLATTTLGYAERSSGDFTTTTVGSYVDVTDLSVTVTVPAGGRRIKVTAYANHIRTSAATLGVLVDFAIREGGTTLSYSTVSNHYNSGDLRLVAHTIYSAVASAGSHTYKVSIKQDTAGTLLLNNQSGGAAFILVELI